MTKTAFIGKETDSYAIKCAEVLAKFGPYKTQKSEGKISFRLRSKISQAGSLLGFTEWLSKYHLDKFNLDEILKIQSIDEIDKTHIVESDIVNILDTLSKFEGIHFFERISRALFYSSIEQLPEVLKNYVSLVFFERYPNGRVMVVWGMDELNKALAILRILGNLIDLPEKDYSSIEKMGPLKTLIHAQNAGIFFAGKHLSLPLTLFLPKLYISVANKVSIGFLFLLDKPMIDCRQPFPRSGLEFFRSEASSLFRQDRDVPLESLTPDAIDQFRLVEKDFSNDDLRAFLRQYIRKLGKFLTYVVDPTNFIDDESNWIGYLHYRVWLSFERISDEVILMLTDDNSYLRKSAFFRIFDQLSSLFTSENFEQTTAFRNLIIPPSGSIDPIAEGIKTYRGSIGTYLHEILPKLRKELVDTAINSIFITELVDRERRLVTLKNGKTLSFEEYSADLIRELRNTNHSYLTSRFNEILSISTGDTPESLPAIAAITYLAFLARPDLFFLRKW